MRVIVAGATEWSDEAVIRRELARLPAGCTVIHGDSPGADALAGRIAREELGLVVEAWSKNAADRQRYGRAAWKGLNERMLDSGAELVLAFHADLDNSRGTKHLVELARARSIEVVIIIE
jgi:kynureninase